MISKKNVGIHKVFQMLLIIPMLLAGTSRVAETGTSEHIKTIQKPVEFRFGEEDMAEAKGRCFDIIHILNQMGPGTMMVGSKTFYVARDVNVTGLREGMFVGIKLNARNDTIVSIDAVETPEWWRKR